VFDRRIEWGTWIAVFIAVVAPLALSLYLVNELAVQRQRDRAMAQATEVLLRTESMGDQMEVAFDRIDRAGYADPCCADAIEAMKQLDLSSSYLQAVGHVSGNRLVCSSLADTGAAIDLGPPDLLQPTGVLLRQNVTIGGNTFVVAQRNGNAAILHKELPLDVAVTHPDTILAVVTHAGKLLASRGKVPAAWLASARAGESTSYLDAGHAVAVVVSKRRFVRAIAATSPAALRASRLAYARVILPVALTLSAVLLLVVLRQARQQRSMPSALRIGLTRGEFHLVYQPIVDLRTGRWVGAEALMRWTRRTGESIRPDLFIPVAEEAGLSGAITRHLIQLAGRDLRGALSAHPDFYLALNLAAPDLHDPTLAEVLSRLVADMRATPGQVTLEVTEHALTEEADARSVVSDLRKSGMRVAIDDFGTGFSNLSRLESLQLDVLKIDKSFIDPIGQGAATSQVVLHIISMARALGLKLVAEGVETQAQAEFLRGQGVEFAQGWLFDRPMKADDLLRALASRASPDA